MEKLRRLFRDASAATAVEYGLIAAIISVSLLLGLEQVRDALTTVLNVLATTFQNAQV
ncbi:Flp family type IVb pilin [Ensifer sp. B1-9]|uniref:Flp family type IVb pilin n=1 Tax=Ensifer sp. B1-9 TaxID=3141455 RepID=UPI003D215021